MCNHLPRHDTYVVIWNRETQKYNCAVTSYMFVDRVGYVRCGNSTHLAYVGYYSDESDGQTA
jgi:hypothetical protein